MKEEWQALNELSHRFTYDSEPARLLGRIAERLKNMDTTKIVKGVHRDYELLDTSPANAAQVGGNHYRKYAIQPWDYIAANGLDYFQGNIVSYVTRFRDKGGLQDLDKAKHYLQKLIELEQQKQKEHFENTDHSQDQ